MFYITLQQTEDGEDYLPVPQGLGVDYKSLLRNKQQWLYLTMNQLSTSVALLLALCVLFLTSALLFHHKLRTRLKYQQAAHFILPTKPGSQILKNIDMDGECSRL